MEALRKFNREYKERISKLDVSNLELKEILEETKMKKFETEKELKVLKDKLTDSGHNDFEEIQDKLYKLDPSAFR